MAVDDPPLSVLPAVDLGRAQRHTLLFTILGARVVFELDCEREIVVQHRRHVFGAPAIELFGDAAADP